MPTLHCTEPVCRHTWAERPESRVPRCPRCGGFWVRVDATMPRTAAARVAAPGLVRRPATLIFR